MTPPTDRELTAWHEAGHAVTSFVLGRRFTRITIEPGGDNLGQVEHPLPGSWLRPDVEINARTRDYIEHRIMILLAGAETERQRYERVTGRCPRRVAEQVDAGAERDLIAACSLADHMCTGEAEVGAYLEWLRQRQANL